MRLSGALLAVLGASAVLLVCLDASEGKRKIKKKCKPKKKPALTTETTLTKEVFHDEGGDTSSSDQPLTKESSPKLTKEEESSVELSLESSTEESSSKEESVELSPEVSAKKKKKKKASKRPAKKSLLGSLEASLKGPLKGSPQLDALEGILPAEEGESEADPDKYTFVLKGKKKGKKKQRKKKGRPAGGQFSVIQQGFPGFGSQSNLLYQPPTSMLGMIQNGPKASNEVTLGPKGNKKTKKSPGTQVLFQQGFPGFGSQGNLLYQPPPPNSLEYNPPTNVAGKSEESQNAAILSEPDEIMANLNKKNKKKKGLKGQGQPKIIGLNGPGPQGAANAIVQGGSGSLLMPGGSPPRPPGGGGFMPGFWGIGGLIPLGGGQAGMVPGTITQGGMVPGGGGIVSMLGPGGGPQKKKQNKVKNGPKGGPAGMMMPGQFGNVGPFWSLGGIVPGPQMQQLGIGIPMQPFQPGQGGQTAVIQTKRKKAPPKQVKKKKKKIKKAAKEESSLSKELEELEDLDKSDYTEYGDESDISEDVFADYSDEEGPQAKKKKQKDLDSEDISELLRNEDDVGNSIKQHRRPFRPGQHNKWMGQRPGGAHQHRPGHGGGIFGLISQFIHGYTAAAAWRRRQEKQRDILKSTQSPGFRKWLLRGEGDAAAAGKWGPGMGLNGGPEGAHRDHDEGEDLSDADQAGQLAALEDTTGTEFKTNK